MATRVHQQFQRIVMAGVVAVSASNTNAWDQFDDEWSDETESIDELDDSGLEGEEEGAEAGALEPEVTSVHSDFATTDTEGAGLSSGDAPDDAASEDDSDSAGDSGADAEKAGLAELPALGAHASDLDVGPRENGEPSLVPEGPVLVEPTDKQNVLESVRPGATID